MTKNNARITPTELYWQAGINPKTGLPVRLGSVEGELLKESIRKQLRVLHEQNAVNRYKWTNLPVGLSSQELERLIYYRGQLAFFYLEELNQFYILPYALSGTIDAYGRFNTVHPVPIASGSKDKETASQEKSLADYLATKKFDVLYDVVLPEELSQNVEGYINKCCVLLHDYTKQMSETIISRAQLDDPLLDIMSNCIPYMNTALANGTGVTGVKVQSEDESAQVMIASKAIQKAALTGEKWIPMQGGLDFQDLSAPSLQRAEEYLLSMQGLDNYRLSLLGLDNGGLFQKKSHMLEAEQEMNAGNMSLILRDGLNIRQRFCDIVNSVWGIGIACYPSEEVINADLNGDGIVGTDTVGETASASTSETKEGKYDV